MKDKGLKVERVWLGVKKGWKWTITTEDKNDGFNRIDISKREAVLLFKELFRTIWPEENINV